MSPEILWQWRTFADLTTPQLYQILQLRQQVFVIEQQCCYDDIDDWDQDATHLLGMNADGQLLAYIRVFAANVRFTDACIGRVLTHASMRGQGLGHELMRRGIEYCDQSFPNTAIRISAQAHLTGFYEQHGFVVAGEQHLVDGIPHVDLIRSSDASSQDA